MTGSERRVVSQTQLKLAVIIPTKGNASGLQAAHASMLRTSKRAEMIACIDNNDRLTYNHVEGDRLKKYIGEPGSIVSIVNAAVAMNPGYDVYGLLVDDARFNEPGWEDYVDRAILKHPGRIVVVSPAHTGGPWVNFPYVSKEWIAATGYFACEHMEHFCWDTVAEVLGTATAIERATNSEFFIQHDRLQRFPRSLARDCEKFLWWCAAVMPESVDKLRKAAMVPAHV